MNSARPAKRRWATGLVLAGVIVVGVLIGWLARPETESQPATAEAADDSASAQVRHADHATLLAATRAGSSRIVAVGEHGVVVLSDDEGVHWRQAGSVPTQALLTGVAFVDAQQGWAVGHDGVILHSVDGGEHWTRQREQLKPDRPLMAVRFADAQHGLAVGQFGLALRTADGGATWTEAELIPGSPDDKHLYAIFGDASVLCIASEAGAIYRSTDQGATWTLVQTDNRGSFWAGLALADGSLVAAGQRGHVFVSHDHGVTWAEVPSGTQQSLTSIAQAGADGSLIVTGLAGVTLRSPDSAAHFAAAERPDRLPLTAVVGETNKVYLFSGSGVVGSD